MKTSGVLKRRASMGDVLHHFHDALIELGADHEMHDVERLGTLVHEAMSLDSRHYHDVSHAVSVAEPGDAIEKLAGLFHDVVYFHVDRMLAPSISRLLSPVVTDEGGVVRLDPGACNADRAVQIALAVFGVSPRAGLEPSAGLNELLSAMVAVKALEPLLPESDLAQIAACIETTIPFRDPSVTPALSRRVARVSRDLGLGLEDVDRCLLRAVNVTNRDLASFAREDATEFLAETWLLFAESNPLLARKGGFSIGDFRSSLTGALGFYEQLDPKTIFVTYRGTPSAEVIDALTERAVRNLEHGTDYLRMKFISIAIIEALARATGGDTLISMFMGELPGMGGRGVRLEDYLPARNPPPDAEISPVYRLLAEGRAAGSDFDIPDSPMSVYLHDRLGEAGVLALYAPATAMVSNALAPKDFLAQVRRDVLHDLVQACRQTAWTRAEALDGVLRSVVQG